VRCIRFGLKGVERDEAARWFTKAAHQGCEYSQEKIAGMYFRGEDVQQDLAKARYYYFLAVEKLKDRIWVEKSLLRLSEMYQNGLGVERDDISAYMYRFIPRLWSDVNEGLDHSLAALGANMTPKQISDAQRRAREWNAHHRS
jgi:TPR repeat protein